MNEIISNLRQRSGCKERHDKKDGTDESDVKARVTTGLNAEFNAEEATPFQETAWGALRLVY
jgi:hypothetical protein